MVEWWLGELDGAAGARLEGDGASESEDVVIILKTVDVDVVEKLGKSELSEDMEVATVRGTLVSEVA